MFVFIIFKVLFLPILSVDKRFGILGPILSVDKRFGILGGRYKVKCLF